MNAANTLDIIRSEAERVGSAPHLLTVTDEGRPHSVAAGVRWYSQSRAEASARQFYGANELFKREQWDQAQKDFASLASSYGGTAYGRLAVLYVAHSALRAGRNDDAAKGYRQYLDAGAAA